MVGSLSVERVCRVEEFPCPGEKVVATDFQFERGGKGASQAIAAVRQEVEVSLIGAVGDDKDGSEYLVYLKEEHGIDVTGVGVSPLPTGIEFITEEEDSGEQMAVIAEGANESVSRSDISDLRKLITSASTLLLQLELPLFSVVEAIAIANRASIPVILNPSPMMPAFPWSDVAIDHVVVNEEEASELFDYELEFNDFEFLRSGLHDRRIGTMVVTRGSDTTLVYTREGDYFEVEPLPVLPIDPKGAGDAFVGCFAARIADGKTVEDAVRAANCAGALTTLGGGAHRPIPDRDKVDQHLEQIPKRRKTTRRA